MDRERHPAPVGPGGLPYYGPTLQGEGGRRRVVKVTPLLIASLLVACSAPLEGAAGTAAQTATRPSASPEPVLRVKMGTPITFEDGLRLTVLSVEDQRPGTGFLSSTPAPDTRFIAIFVRFDNGSPVTVDLEGYAFALSDGRGVRHTRVNLSGVPRSDEFKSGNVTPGSALAGSLIFEAPTADTKLELIYSKVGYRTATIELY